MTPERLKSIDDRLAACRGPTWSIEYRVDDARSTLEDGYHYPARVVVESEYSNHETVCQIPRGNGDEARFIAAARTDIPDLIEAVRERDKRIAELEDRCAILAQAEREARRSRP